MVTQQLERVPDSAAAMGETSNINLSNVSNVNNVAVFTHLLTQMLLVNSNNISNLLPPVSTISTAAGLPLSVDVTAVGNSSSVPAKSQSSNVDLLSVTAPNVCNSSATNTNTAATWAGGNMVPTTSYILLVLLRLLLVKARGCPRPVLKRHEHVRFHPLSFHLPHEC